MNKCNNCKKTFKTPAQLVEHEKNYCRKCHVCKDCGSSFHKFSNLIRHQKNRKIITCDHCKENFCNEEHFQKHVRSIESRVDNTIADLNQRIYPDSGYEDEDGYREILNQKHNEIKDWQKKHLHYEVINKQIEPWYNYWELYFSLYDLYLTRKSAFKINLGFGFILYDTVNKKIQVSLCVNQQSAVRESGDDYERRRSLQIHETCHIVGFGDEFLFKETVKWLGARWAYEYTIRNNKHQKRAHWWACGTPRLHQKSEMC